MIAYLAASMVLESDVSIKNAVLKKYSYSHIVHWIGKKPTFYKCCQPLRGNLIFFEEKLDVELQTQVLKLGLLCTRCYPRAILFETKMHCSTLWGVQVPGKLKISWSLFKQPVLHLRGDLNKKLSNNITPGTCHAIKLFQSCRTSEPPIPFRSNHSKSTCLCWYVEPSTATRARECSNLLQGIVLNTWMDESRWSFNHFFSTRLLFSKVG